MALRIETGSRGRGLDGTPNTGSDIPAGRVGIRITGADPGQGFTITLARGVRQVAVTVTTDATGFFQGTRAIPTQQILDVLDNLGWCTWEGAGPWSMSNGDISLRIETA